MAQENGVQNSAAAVEAESVVIISTNQVQSINVPAKFTREKTSDGWHITLHNPCKVVVNLTTSMRRIEINLIEGDRIEKNESDMLILRNHPADVYKSQSQPSPLARSREDLLQQSETTKE
jgi:hypothetical protein